MKILGALLAMMLFLCSATGEQKTHASDFGDERFLGSRDFDFRTLVEMEPQVCLQSFGALRTTYLYPDGGWPERPEMVDTASYWAARNPQLAAHFQARTERKPVLFENYTERTSLLTAAAFPAEWAIRFYARQIMDDRAMTSKEIDLDDPNDFEDWFRRSMPNSIPVDDATLARRALVSMKLHNGPPLLEKTGLTDSQYTAATKASAREWIARSQRRFAEIAKATWGDRAVLNADIGLGDDNLPLEHSSKPPAARRQSKALNHIEKSNAIDREPANATRAVSLMPLVIASGILVIAFGLLRRAYANKKLRR